MSDIFISYASEDRPRAEILAQTLERRGWSTFWDRTIPIGKTWRETIGRELHGARCVIVLWSKSSIESHWVQEEADDAQERGVLVPILIENIRAPIGFRSIQAAHLENWDGTESTQPFLRLIADIAGLIGPPPSAKKRANGPRHRSSAGLRSSARPRKSERGLRSSARPRRSERGLRSSTRPRKSERGLRSSGDPRKSAQSPNTARRLKNISPNLSWL